MKSLQEQIDSLELTPAQRSIAEIVIADIDDFGYLKSSVEELCTSSGFLHEEVSMTLKFVQTLNPPGIAARDLRECLMLQLERAGRNRTVEYRIVSGYMGLLGKRDLAGISNSLGLPLEEVRTAIESLTHLHLRPLKAELPISGIKQTADLD
jgi:RNA polymerase sigma-54 factor